MVPWSSLSRTEELWKLAKFSLVGFVTVGIYFAILFATSPIIKSTAALAAVAYAGSAIFNYVTQRNFTFQEQLANSVSFFRYIAMHAFVMMINSGLMFLLVDVAMIGLYLASVAVAAITAAISFLLSRFWVYAEI